MLIFEIVLIFVCLFLGGLLKGATGAGAPLLAVPALAAIFDVPFAVAIMVIPNVITNTFQAWQYRDARQEAPFAYRFAAAGVVGVVLGTVMLVGIPSDTLMVGLGTIVLVYIILRLARPGWHLAAPVAKALSMPAGLLSGFLQGSTGLSAPVSLTFLNAARLGRPVFIFTVSMLFCTFTVAQLAAISFAGVLTPERALMSLFAVVPILLGMPVGAKLGKRLPPVVFDRVILLFLALLAVELIVDAVI